MTLMTVPNVIDGKSVAGSSTDTLEVLDPSTGEVIASFTESTPGDVDDAVQAAKAAFPAWAAKSPAQRSEALHALADLFAQDSAEFARSNPSTPASRHRGDRRDFQASWKRCDTSPAPVACCPLRPPANSPPTTAYVRREPVGVVAGITPWNFPLWQAIWKLAPALIAGNTIVIKPAENTPVSTTRLIELANKCFRPGRSMLFTAAAASPVRPWLASRCRLGLLHRLDPRRKGYRPGRGDASLTCGAGTRRQRPGHHLR